MAFKHGISEGAVYGFTFSVKKFREIFEKHPQFCHFPLGIGRGNKIFENTLAKWLLLLGISEEVIKMASILMPRQKFRSRKRHQFWCHRRKSAPFWSLVLSTTDKIRQFGAKNKLFSREAHRNRLFVLSPWGAKISFNPQLLTFLDGYPLREKKESLSKWFSFGTSRRLPDGREFFKRLNFRFFSWSTPWGRKFRSRHNFWPLQVGTSEEIFKTEVKNGFLAGYSLGEKFFESTPPNGFSHWE